MNQMKNEKIHGEPVEVDEETAAVAAEAAGVDRPKRSKRLIVMLIVPLILLAGGLYYWMTSGESVSTDNAQVKQDIVSVAAQVNGPIVEVAVKDGDRVKRGDLLFRIDPQPYRVALEQAEAQLAAARLQTTQLRTQSAGTGADITGAAADLEIKRRALSRQ
ncbi:MAG: biotin/lipoyl-binding protein, partial [Sphingomicrobium sp.]